MNVCYLGPLKDYSGYGEANRNFVAALDTAGVNVIPQLVSYSAESSDFGTLGSKISHLFDHRGEYRIKILHTTPNEFKKYIEKDVYHIAHFFWETDKVPDDFADGLKLCNEIWTGSRANVDAIKKAGVDIPVHVIPQAIETDREWPDPYLIPEFNGYLFYSIFEWTDRKNPDALLKAYWSAFQDGENVGLVIKTYHRNFTLQNKRMIKHHIENLKSKSGLTNFPPVFLYLDLMDRRQISRLHSTGDVYVSAHRGEGWGVPQVEAALAGKPMISTAYSGCHEYFVDQESALLMPYEMVPLVGMTHSDRWYCNDQNWAEIDSKALESAFQYAYANKPAMKAIGAHARDLVVKTFNFEQVGRLMLDRLNEIEKELKK